MASLDATTSSKAAVHGQVLTECGMFGMPKPQGWTVERAVSLMAGAVVLTTQIAWVKHPSLLRILAGWVGANLLLNAIVGWCPFSVLLHRLGIPTGAERALSGGVGHRVADGEHPVAPPE